MVLVKSIKKFTAKLNKTQQKAMNRHARHHSLKHMREMVEQGYTDEQIKQLHPEIEKFFSNDPQQEI